jgi:hypothetical protein
MPKTLFVLPPLAHPQVKAESQVRPLLEELPHRLAVCELKGSRRRFIPGTTEVRR